MQNILIEDKASCKVVLIKNIILPIPYYYSLNNNNLSDGFEGIIALYNNVLLR